MYPDFIEYLIKRLLILQAHTHTRLARRATHPKKSRKAPIAIIVSGNSGNSEPLAGRVCGNRDGVGVTLRVGVGIGVSLSLSFSSLWMEVGVRHGTVPPHPPWPCPVAAHADELKASPNRITPITKTTAMYRGFIDVSQFGSLTHNSATSCVNQF
jgi:hypothetical protein